MATKKKRPPKRTASKRDESKSAEPKLRTNTASTLRVSGRVVSDDFHVNGKARPLGRRDT
jgi:hypothetical protein